MTPSRWRALLLTLCVAVAILDVCDIVVEYAGPHSTTVVGQWGSTLSASAQPYNLIVLTIDPGHASDIAGLRPGDLIDIRANSPAERFWLFGQPPTGRPVAVLARRGLVQRHVTLLPQTTSPLRLWLVTPIWFGFLWLALFAGVIAWRRSGDTQMRALCLLLVSYAFWETTNQHYLTSESVWVLVVAATINVLGTLTVAFWAACAGAFAAPRSRLRRGLQFLCYGFVAMSIAIGLAKILAIATLWSDPMAFGSSVAALPFVLAIVTALLCTFSAISATRDSERQRAIWSLFPAASLILVGFGAEALQGVVTSYELAWGVFYVASFFTILAPLILTYVALNRRLLDIGFVINRAAVYAILSSILIGAFVLVEWIANEWLSASHTTSAIVGMLVALALGLSMRYIHRFADGFVDRVFFRKRHEDEAALRRFAHEAAFITDRATLLERALQTVKSSTGTDASILLFDDANVTIDENDPALVALRAWHKPVDLEAFPESALHGQFAFPMVSRGALAGVLVCGTKQDSEVYAPDESEALQALALGVGSALSLLAVEGARSAGSLAETLAELRAAIAELRALKT